MGIEDNVELRRKARELLSLSDDNSPAFYKTLADECLRRVGSRVEDRDESSRPATMSPAMSDAQAASFGRTCRLPFGKHQGKLVKDVPLGYLEWIADNIRDKPVGREVERYLRSATVQRERQAEETRSGADSDDTPF